MNQLPSDPEVVELSEPVSQIDPVRFAEEMHRAYRKANRPYRRAFRGIVHGELGRKILLAVGVSNAKAMEGHMLHPSLPAATWRAGADG